MRLRLTPDACIPMDCVPWKQMTNSSPLTPVERANFCKFTGYRLAKGAVVVRYDRRRIFAKSEDLAVCIYDYARSFA